ncbi:hypothetical protein F4780DRAFT_573970 [Xylariomycetidae sp. FL0641]|nr:hypothetical protein F4780DRAFT_573970 [Xylariomycetidae sp. FL0641]
MMRAERDHERGPQYPMTGISTIFQSPRCLCQSLFAPRSVRITGLHSNGPGNNALAGYSHQRSSWLAETLQSDRKNASVSSNEHGYDERPKTCANRSWPWALTVWRFELLAFILSATSFLALTSIGMRFSDRPLSEWQIRIITINGVAAALTTLMKGALMVVVASSVSQGKWTWFLPSAIGASGRPFKQLESIDEASRGLWGSLTWLLRHPFHFNLITFGSLLTVLAGPLDTFSQLFISIKERSIVDPELKAHIPWADSNTKSMSQGTLLTATYVGMYSDRVDDLPPHCPSGNCTWDTPVPSLSLCGRCWDTTPSSTDSWTSCSGAFCDYTGPGHLAKIVNGPRPNIPLRVTDLHLSADGVGRVNTGAMASKSSRATSFRVANEEIKGIRVLDFEVIDIPVSSNLTREQRNGDTVWLDLGPGNAILFEPPSVTRCALWRCIYAFRPKVVAGQLHQTIDVCEEPNTDPPLNASTPPTVTFENVQGFNMQKHKFTFSLDDTTQIVKGFPAEEARYITQTGHGGPNGSVPGPLGYNIYDSPFLSRWNDTRDDHNAWIERYAKSLNNALRINCQPAAADDVYAGQVWVQQTYVEIVWPWIVYPGLMLVASLALLSLSIATSRRDDRYAWGDGGLALAVSGVDDAVRESVKGAFASSRELVEAVGNTKVQLRVDDNGMRFQRTDVL